jgi:putative peptidoglycan lipid II flippase
MTRDRDRDRDDDWDTDTDEDPPHDPPDADEARRRRLRPRPAAYDNELHYGEANRQRARDFQRRSESAVADRPGRRWARRPDDPRPGDGPTSDEPPYRPDDLTGELPVAADMFGLAADPGIAHQPLAPWMTGEHQAIRVDEPVGEAVDEAAMPVEGMAPPAPPAPARVRPDTRWAPAPPQAPPAEARWDTEPTGEIPRVPAAPAEPTPPSSERGSFLVAAGILLSRCAGLIREIVISAFLGTSPAADAFKAALRIPNLMQNLLGEGVLSASFIPVYARLRGEGRHEEAGRLAGAIAGLLAALTGVISLFGILFAGPLTSVLAPGFSGEKRELTVQLTQIMFPGIAFLVLSAWCLGVLNSHRQFFLSYVAPVLWNVAQIAALLVGVVVVGGFETGADQRDLAVWLAWGVLAGGILQFGIQIGPVRRLLGSVQLSLGRGNEWVRTVVSRFTPVLLGRGAVQIMGWIDLLLASFLVSGAISSLTYTMVLYLLPVSLFGVSVAAAELPDLSQVEVHDPDTRRRFRLRLEDSMGRIAWYVAFTSTMFIVVGDVIVAAVLERGSFDHGDTIVVWLALAVLSMGLLPVTATRLLQNGLYALDDARTPARLGVFGVVLSAVIGVAFMFPLDRLFVTPDGIEGWGDVFAIGPLPQAVRDNPLNVPHLGIVGLAFGAMVSDWIEYRMLSTALAWRVGRTKLAGRWLTPLAVASAIAAAVAFFAQMVFAGLPSILEAIFVLGPAGAAYMAVTHRLGVPEALATWQRVRRVLRR